MHLVSFVCLRAWTGPAGKGAGFGSTKGGGRGPPPPSEGGGVPPPPTAPQTVEHPSGSHIGWRRPPWFFVVLCMRLCCVNHICVLECANSRPLTLLLLLLPVLLLLLLLFTLAATPSAAPPPPPGAPRSIAPPPRGGHGSTGGTRGPRGAGCRSRVHYEGKATARANGGEV